MTPPGRGGILSLDLSLTTGFAYGCFNERPVWGHWSLGRMARSGEAFAVLEDHIDEEIRRYGPRAVVFEAPIPSNKSTNGSDTVRLLLGLCAIVELISVRHKLVYYHQNANQARSKVLGANPRGKSHEIKPVIIGWANRRGWRTNQDDEADALLLLVYSTVQLDQRRQAHFHRHGEVL